ncbi:MAG TPA: LCP family protein [Firmicutes bacterium]|nr:LCP family protein [Bacillota bacterium]
MKKLRKGLAFLVLSCVLVGIVSTLCFTAYFWLKGFQNPEVVQSPQAKAASLPTTILVLGVDSGVDSNGHVIREPLKSHTRSDTMMLVSLDQAENRIGVLSVPRDTRVQIPGRSGYEKIAHANAYGGPALAMKTVEALLEVPVDFYVRIDFMGFKALVDALGGVEMTIPQQLDYEDPYQNLYIHIKAGKQLLNGEKALQVIRYRQYPNGDIGRIEMQQKFIQALMNKLFQLETLSRLPAIQREMVKYVDTNMSPSDMVRLMMMAKQAKEYNLETGILPGEPAFITDSSGAAISYWVVNKSSAQKVVDKTVRGIDHDANAKYRVSVVDASGTGGNGKKLERLLASQGFNVVPSEEVWSKEPQEFTVLVQNSNRTEAFKAVERSVLYCCEDVRTRRKISDDPPVDVTIILGKNFSTAVGGR